MDKALNGNHKRRTNGTFLRGKVVVRKSYITDIGLELIIAVVIAIGLVISGPR